jgi:hypothetical protein
MITKAMALCLPAMLAGGCAGSPTPQLAPERAPVQEPSVSFADDLAFLQKHTSVVLLQDAAGKARVAVAPEYQGRVMTSSAAGDSGASFGWINRAFIAEGKRVPHMNVFGGEDRFWLGPEGGQYALYFAKGAPFDLQHWQVPEAIDWGGWSVAAQSPSEVRFEKDMQLANHSGTSFSLRVQRTVRVLEREPLVAHLKAALPPELELVAYESENTITNTGEQAWTRERGLLSIWILGMYNPTPHTTVVIPFRAGEEAELGPIVNDAYFGKVPADRLRVDAQSGVLFFRGDGQQRGKIGIPGPRALPLVGSYDTHGRVLTLVQYSLTAGATDYVNSMWELQERPYGGDVVNSYNDGPLAPGKPGLGPFYELETSSAAAALAPGQSLTHVHRTVHVTGARTALDALARSTLGVDLARVETAFSQPAKSE